MSRWATTFIMFPVAPSRSTCKRKPCRIHSIRKWWETALLEVVRTIKMPTKGSCRAVVPIRLPSLSTKDCHNIRFSTLDESSYERLAKCSHRVAEDGADERSSSFPMEFLLCGFAAGIRCAPKLHVSATTERVFLGTISHAIVAACTL